jgi:hypothetical protein
MHDHNRSFGAQPHHLQQGIAIDGKRHGSGMFEAPAPYKSFSKSGIESLKKKAKRLKKQNGKMTHHEALDVVAHCNGFDSWRILVKQNDAAYIYQQIHDRSVTMLFDEKDFEAFKAKAVHETWWQSLAGYSEWLAPVLYKKYVLDCENNCEQPRRYDDFTSSDSGNYLVAVTPAVMPKNEDELLSFLENVMRFSAFAPVQLVYRGEILNTTEDLESRLMQTLHKAMGIRVETGPA